MIGKISSANTPTAEKTDAAPQSKGGIRVGKNRTRLGHGAFRGAAKLVMKLPITKPMLSKLAPAGQKTRDTRFEQVKQDILKVSDNYSAVKNYVDSSMSKSMPKDVFNKLQTSIHVGIGSGFEVLGTLTVPGSSRSDAWAVAGFNGLFGASDTTIDEKVSKFDKDVCQYFSVVHDAIEGRAENLGDYAVARLVADEYMAALSEMITDDKALTGLADRLRVDTSDIRSYLEQLRNLLKAVVGDAGSHDSAYTQHMSTFQKNFLAFCEGLTERGRL